MKRKLILIGLPGSGKTTVGGLLAERLGLPFADCDDLIQQAAGMTIPAIFAEKGEPWFRALESRLLAELCAGPRQVIATGGGAVVAEGNRKLLKSSGYFWIVISAISTCAWAIGSGLCCGRIRWRSWRRSGGAGIWTAPTRR